ncbi:sodium/mannose cotransporter SLC5A10-like [Engraulis encrasicolus]|uniref:sodium/mannose cotransporter SLC5A10-like n=1 Tax=Engraulis encrasicolus TaxID=184585 RepID=UPI002FD12F0E
MGGNGLKDYTMYFRLAVVFLVVISVVWIPILQSANSGQLYVYIQSVTSYLAPPITATFTLAVFWPRTNEQGAFWGLMVGLAVGVSRMLLEFAFPPPRCGIHDDAPSVLRSVHYLHFAILLWAITMAIIIGISLLTPPPPPEQVRNLTWWTLSGACSRDIPLQKVATITGSLRRTRCVRSTGICSPHPTRATAAAAATTTLPTIPSTREEPFWKHFCCANAILLVCVNVFLYAYYA